MDAKRYFTANLNRLLKLADLREPEFIRQFSERSGTKLRPPAIREWLTGDRVAYKNNLEQLTVFWRGWVPNLDATHLFLPPDEFEEIVTRARDEGDKLGGIVINLEPAEISEDELSSLCGSYRIFRYDFRDARIVSEALSIKRRLKGNKSILDAQLWSPTTRVPQEFQGTVIVLGSSVYMVLHDVDATSPMMRFVSLTMTRREGGVAPFGMMAGSFDATGTNAAMGISIERKNADPSVAEQAVRKPAQGNNAWVLANATGAVDPAVLIMLQRPIQPKAS